MQLDQQRQCRGPCGAAKALADFRPHHKGGRRHTCRACESLAKRRTPGPAAPPAPLASPAPASAPAPLGLGPVVADGRPRLVCVLSDVHVETRWMPLWRGFIAWATEWGVDFDVLALNGDFLDLESASQHGGNPRPPTLTEDIAEAKDVLRDLARLFPNASRVYLEGNHETRVPRFLAANAPTLAGSLEVPALLGLDASGWRWVPTDKQPAESRWGPLRLIHGHQVRGSGGVVPANTLLNKWWASAGTTVACGHFHRYTTAGRQAVEASLRAISLPTMTTPFPSYTGGAHDHWDFGFTVFELLGPHLRHEPILADSEGRFLYRGRVYGGS